MDETTGEKSGKLSIRRKLFSRDPPIRFAQKKGTARKPLFLFRSLSSLFFLDVCTSSPDCASKTKAFSRAGEGQFRDQHWARCLYSAGLFAASGFSSDQAALLRRAASLRLSQGAALIPRQGLSAAGLRGDGVC